MLVMARVLRHELVMSFELRQAQRHRKLSLVMFAAKMLGAVYMSLHIAVAVLAFKLSGAVAAILTLAGLGFADAYWAAVWLAEEGHGSIAAVACTAALLCFASWLGRSHFKRWTDAFTAEMLRDAAAEIETVTRQSGHDEPDPRSASERDGAPDRKP